MTNHYLDENPRRTRCGSVEGDDALWVSSNGRVSCPDCAALLTTDERKNQWYASIREGDR